MSYLRRITRRLIRPKETARSALESLNYKYRVLFEDNPQPMWIYDTDTLKFLEVNEAAVVHYGYSREEFLAMTIRDIRPPEDVKALLEDVGRRKLTLHSDGPWRHRKKDGTAIQVRITSVPIQWEDRQAKFVLATDITAQQEAEAALHRSEARYRVILEAASDAIVTIDENSTVVFASAPLEKIFGYSPDEIIGQNLMMLIPERLRPAHLVGIQRYITTNQRHVPWNLIAFPGLHKDGREIPLELSFGEFCDGPQRLFTGVIRDVSDRQQAQERLREANDLLQTVFETVPLAIRGLDLNGNVTLWNRAAERLFGWTKDEVIGQFAPLIPEDQMPEFQQWLQDFAAGRQLTAIERKRRRKDGTEIDCAIWTAPLRSASGAITGTIGILADITERKRADQKTAGYLRNLARTNADLQQLAYAASHDLQEPLRQITMHTQMLERRFAHSIPPEAQEYLHLVREGASRIRAQIDALQEYWNLQYRKLNLRLVPLVEPLQQALDRLRPQIVTSKAGVSWADLPTVYGDRDLLAELLYQLLDNALKFHAGAAPEISISATKSAENCTVVVRDNGIGMDPSYLEQTFRIFQRLSRDYDGVGIGLSLCKLIMERHNGRIRLESVPGKGTTVYAQFPHPSA